MAKKQHIPLDTEGAAGYQALFENMLNGVAHMKVCRDKKGAVCDFQYIDVNHAFEKIVGLKRTEAVNRKASEIFPEMNKEWYRIAEKVLAEKRGRRFENHRENGDKWYNISIYSPQPEEIVLLFDDVTDFRRAQEQVQESEEKYRTFLEYSFDMIQVVAADGNITYTSLSVKKILGYDPAMLIGNRFDTIIHPEDKPAAAEALNPDICKPGMQVHRVCRCRHMNGSWRVLLGTATNCLDNPQIHGFLLNIRDITEQRKMEDHLRESEQKFRSIIEQSGDGIVIIDARGEIIEYNAMQERIAGIPRADAIGREIWDIQYKLLPMEQRTSQTFREHKKKYSEFLKTGTADWINKVFEVTAHRADGSRIIMQTMVSPITVGGNRLYVSFNRDVTALRHAEKELEEQNRMLEAKNTALREIMERLEAEKKRVGDQVISNMERLVLPLLEKVRGRGTDEDRKYLGLLEANLREITSGFGNGISAKMNKLTQKETEICDMIKRGLSSKEIGKLLNISHRTAETHRNRIRKKLEIQDPAVNLQTYLKNL